MIIIRSANSNPNHWNHDHPFCAHILLRCGVKTAWCSWAGQNFNVSADQASQQLEIVDYFFGFKKIFRT